LEFSLLSVWYRSSKCQLDFVDPVLPANGSPENIATKKALPLNPIPVPNSQPRTGGLIVKKNILDSKPAKVPTRTNK
tara:strand:+ start:804 stop:1034 length:231 start_codon:yes stop_codon:yes gene_type:complete